MLKTSSPTPNTNHNVMAGLLLSLPNEILVRILGACSTQALISLSSVNRRLRAIFLEHSNQIIPAAHSDVPCFEDAINLTLTERRTNNPGQSVEPGSRSELCLSLPHILREADTALEVCQRHMEFAQRSAAAYLAAQPPTDQAGHQQPLTLASLLPAYYLMRRTVLAYRHRELRLKLFSQLRSLSRETLHANVQAMFGIWISMPPDMQAKLGMIRAENGYSDDGRFTLSHESWRFAHPAMRACEADSEDDPNEVLCSAWELSEEEIRSAKM